MPEKRTAGTTKSKAAQRPSRAVKRTPGIKPKGGAAWASDPLRPLPPGESKHPEVRYLDIHEDDPFEEELLAGWIRQASRLPGWVP